MIIVMKSLGSAYFSGFISAILFLTFVALTPNVVRDSLADQRAKTQIAEINHIMYGIFSVNAWKDQLKDIVISEIAHFDLNEPVQKLRKTIENQLTAVIDKLNNQIKESNKGSLGGKIKQALINLVVNVDDIKKGVPKYTDAIINEVTKPETQKVVKDMAKKKVRTIVAKSFTEQDMTPVDKVLDQTGTESIAEATAKLQAEIDGRRETLEWRGYSLMGLAVLLFAWVGLPGNRTKFNFTLLFLTSVILLGVGVSIPMIDLEAKISEMSFVLIGHKVTFENQILYFQSKSVINVFWLMMEHPDFKMKAVGILLVTFSIIFPTLKMGASLIYLFSERLRESRVLQFFAFKIGKWSMADVMVIAILMAYIGFNGIVETQFNKMKALVPKDMSFFTTNGTTMQMGYFIFITYVLLALVLSTYVHNVSKSKPREARSVSN